jgi:hypothetical protein
VPPGHPSTVVPHYWSSPCQGLAQPQVQRPSHFLSSQGGKWHRLLETLQQSGLTSLLPKADPSLFPGDFLGIYSGTVRFSEKVSLSHAIPGPGPTAKLWLDYSQGTGALNQMQVSKPDDDGNVGLHWEAVNEQDETGPCESWRVLVITSKAIMSFEPLVRAAPRNEQYLLHQALGFTKRGFMKSTLVTKLKA